MTACFVVTANENGKVRGFCRTAIVRMEITDLAEFHWAGHHCEVLSIADCLGLLATALTVKSCTCLKVPANDQQIYTFPSSSLACFLNRCIYGMQCAMALSSLDVLTQFEERLTYTPFNSNSQAAQFVNRSLHYGLSSSSTVRIPATTGSLRRWRRCTVVGVFYWFRC